MPIEQDGARTYRPDIDGLRGVAVLSVVLFHAGVPFLKGGFVGVDIFFVISGYLIGAHVYSDTSRGRFSIAEFYRRRAKRILPALLALLIVCYVIASLLFSPPELLYFARYSIATILSVSNIVAWRQTGYFAPNASLNSLLMTWSLGVEEQFYLLFPLVMIALGKLARKYVSLALTILALLSLVSCIIISHRSPSTAFYLFPFRAWELLLGVLLAVYENGRQTSSGRGHRWLTNISALAGVALLGFSIFCYGPHTLFPGYAAAAPTLGSLLLICSPTSWINRYVFSLRPIKFVGKISYSYYLWHWPLLSFAHILANGTSSVAIGCSIAAFSLLIAWLSFRFVEQPFRRSTTSRGTLLARYAVCCALVMAPALMFRATQGWPQRFSSFPQGAFDQRCSADLGFSAPILSKECVDLEDSRPAVALIGDSHAAALAVAAREDANRAGFKFYEMVKYQCQPLQKVATTSLNVQQQNECLDYNNTVLSILKKDQRVRFVLITAFWSGPEIGRAAYVRVGYPKAEVSRSESEQNLKDGLEATVAELESVGKQVILIRDVPVFTFDPVLKVLLHHIPMRSLLVTGHLPSVSLMSEAPITQTYLAQEQHADAILDQAANSQHTRVVSLRGNLCSMSSCRYLDGMRMLYSDDHHLTEAGAYLALRGINIIPGMRQDPSTAHLSNPQQRVANLSVR